MALNTKTIAQFAGDAIAAAQSSASGLVDTSVGSIFLSVIDAVAGVASWLQNEVVTLLQTTRASTSTGPDLDSWMADYGLVRLPATFAQGTVTFARFSVGQAASIPVGTVVQNSTGSVQFAVIADTTNGNYVPSLSAYTVPYSTASIDVLVQALVAGTASNLIAGQVSSISGSLPYIDTVTNVAAFTSATDAETDAAFRLRFLTYIASLAKATVAAVAAAIESCGTNITYTIAENTPSIGYFTVVVDNSIYPTPSPLLASVTAAINLVRPIGTMLVLNGSSKTAAAVSMTVTYDNVNFVAATVAADIIAAGQALVSSLGLGQTLYLSKLSQAAFNASSAVIDAPTSGITINSVGANLVPPDSGHVIRVGTTSSFSATGSALTVSLS